MKNIELWRPSKYVYSKNRFYASRDRFEVGLSSRLIADIQAVTYEEALHEHAQGKLLDLGCGKVPLYAVYKRLVQDVLCVDWPNTYHSNLFLDLEADLNHQIPLTDSTYDTILATDVLEHLTNPELFFREIARLLRVQGKLILGVPFLYRIHEQPHDYCRYTEFALLRFCNKNDLNVIKLRPYGGSPEVILDLIAKHLGSFESLSAIHLTISKMIIASPVGRKISQSTDRLFPLGYCLVAQKC